MLACCLQIYSFIGKIPTNSKVSTTDENYHTPSLTRQSDIPTIRWATRWWNPSSTPESHPSLPNYHCRKVALYEPPPCTSSLVPETSLPSSPIPSPLPPTAAATSSDFRTGPPSCCCCKKNFVPSMWRRLFSLAVLSWLVSTPDSPQISVAGYPVNISVPVWSGTITRCNDGCWEAKGDLFFHCTHNGENEMAVTPGLVDCTTSASSWIGFLGCSCFKKTQGTLGKGMET